MFWNQKASKEASEQAARVVELGAFEQAIQLQVPFVQFTPAGVVTFANELFLKIVGFERDEVIGKALFPKSTIKPQLPQPQVTVTLGAF